MTNARPQGFWLPNQRKGDIPFYDPRSEWEVLHGPTAANQVLKSSALNTFSWAALTVADIPNRTRNLFLKATDFTLRSGVPVLSIQGASLRYSAWALDFLLTEDLVTQFTMPEDYVSGAVVMKMHWTNLGAGAGNVAFSIGGRNTATGENLDTVGHSVAGDTIAAPAQNVLTISTMSISFTPDAGEEVSIYVARVGADVADTLANDAGFIGIEIEYTADS